MMFAVLTMVHTAETKEQLDNDTEGAPLQQPESTCVSLRC